MFHMSVFTRKIRKEIARPPRSFANRRNLEKVQDNSLMHNYFSISPYCVITSPAKLFLCCFHSHPLPLLLGILMESPFLLSPALIFLPFVVCCLFFFPLLYFLLAPVMQISGCVWSRTISDAYGHGNICLQAKGQAP